MPSVNTVPQNRVAGQNTGFELVGSNGSVLKFEVNTNGQIAITKDGVAISAPFLRPVVAKTAAYTCLVTQCGTLFTNAGASGSVTFTLPTAAAANAGVWFEFYQVAGQAIVIAPATADTLVCFNDAAADSFSFGTAGELIGNTVRVISDGALWLLTPSIAAEAVTATIVTA